MGCISTPTSCSTERACQGILSSRASRVPQTTVAFFQEPIPCFRRTSSSPLKITRVWIGFAPAPCSALPPSGSGVKLHWQEQR
jgi:hypothetical protein